MTHYELAAAGHPMQSPMSGMVDETRQGSAWAQAITGIVGIVLAVILVVGQISVVTTKGIAEHLHSNVANTREGNRVMRSVIEKAAPSVAMEGIVKGQSQSLAHTKATMTRLNGQMKLIGATTSSLDTTVGGMQKSSNKLAAGVDGMDSDTSQIVKLLGQLPAATVRTHKSLSGIATDTTSINTELAAIAAKMQGYGLPRAKKVRAR